LCTMGCKEEDSLHTMSSRCAISVEAGDCPHTPQELPYLLRSKPLDRNQK
jgi:hypothetical protein